MNNNELNGLKLEPCGEPNLYWLMRDAGWVAKIQMNGFFTAPKQEAILGAMLAAAKPAGIDRDAISNALLSSLGTVYDCTRHGSPLNQEEDDECWMDDPDEQPTGYAPKLIGCTPEEAAGLNLKCYALVHFDDEFDLIVEFEHLIGILPEHAGRYVVEHVLMTEEHFNLVPEFQG